MKFNSLEFLSKNQKLLWIIASIALIFILILAFVAYFRYYALFPGQTKRFQGFSFNSIKNMKKDDRDEFLMNKYNISKDISKNLIIKKNYVLYEKNTNTDKKDQKIIVVFPGNGFSLSSILSGFENGRYLEKYAPYDNIMLINYPSHAFSQKKVIDYGYDAIKELINKGYKVENIDVLGRSIGGGVSAQVLKRLKKENILINNYINFNSFSKINKVLPFSPKHMKNGGLFRKCIAFLSSMIFIGFSFNSERVINDKESYVSGNITVIRTKGDEVIDEYASLSGGVKNQAVKQIENIGLIYNNDVYEAVEENGKRHNMLLKANKNGEISDLRVIEGENTHDLINMNQIIEIFGVKRI
jgi:hypothetical protein